MNKVELCVVLEACLLHFEGISLNELIQTYGLNPNLAEIGVKLCSYLNSIKLMETLE